MDVEPEPLPQFAGWAKRQLEAFQQERPQQ